jgi:2-dehydro-3-deoxyphosphooctonate aldolase (KDO 8-P synthase)
MENHPLARWRKSHKQTLNDLARAAGCAVSHLSQIESGKTNPSLKLIAKLKTITNGAIDASHFMPQDSAPSAKPRVSVGKVKFGNDLPLSIIAGPCQMESREHALEVAGTLAKIAKKLKIGLIYKTSFDKANRTSAKAARGIGIEKAIPIFKEITARTGLPTLTDVHEIEQCAQLRGVVDVLQIPAFLCRQTDLLLAAAKTGSVVNIKKGQFLAPWDMKNVVAKLTGAGNRNVLVTERGASFGYNTLVSDMRALPILASTTGAPVIFDATHSVQQPGGKGTSSGGEREFVPVLARAAVAVGVAGVFIETHPDPDNAPSDGPNMVPLRNFESLIRMLMTFDKLAKTIPVSNKAP